MLRQSQKYGVTKTPEVNRSQHLANRVPHAIRAVRGATEQYDPAMRCRCLSSESRQNVWNGDQKATQRRH